ncbi:MAG: hypothetical protein KGM47_01990, partial [Acidobacteriota bacterium]|nr:hypothetical protein [Acidobacteriota bacterium]
MLVKAAVFAAVAELCLTWLWVNLLNEVVLQFPRWESRMSQAIFNFESARRIYTVSGLTQEIRSLLEPKFLDVWVSGEVSNFRP